MLLLLLGRAIILEASAVREANGHAPGWPTHFADDDDPALLGTHWVRNYYYYYSGQSVYAVELMGRKAGARAPPTLHTPGA